jgi:hypothetical protein
LCEVLRLEECYALVDWCICDTGILEDFIDINTCILNNEKQTCVQVICHCGQLRLDSSHHFILTADVIISSRRAMSSNGAYALRFDMTLPAPNIDQFNLSGSWIQKLCDASLSSGQDETMMRHRQAHGKEAGESAEAITMTRIRAWIGAGTTVGKIKVAIRRNITQVLLKPACSFLELR